MLRTSSLILVFFWFLTACGASHVNYDSNALPTPENMHIDPDLQVLMDEYIRDADAADAPVPAGNLETFKALMWADTLTREKNEDRFILGHCQIRGNSLRFVEIIRPDAEGKIGATKLDDETLKVIVYHELGHCLHGFSGHTDGKEAAIMNATLQPARYFDLNSLVADHFKRMKLLMAAPAAK